MNKYCYPLRILSKLLSYPDAHCIAALKTIETELKHMHVIPAARLKQLAQLLTQLCNEDLLSLQQRYVATFDATRSCSLHLFEHVHGDSRERGQALHDLLATYAQNGLVLMNTEMPDHLCVVCEFASTLPEAQSKAFLSELSALLQHLYSALSKIQSPYASVAAALLELIGEKVKVVEVAIDPPCDESWQEPPAFQGCQMNGQSSLTQPLQFVKPYAQPGVSS